MRATAMRFVLILIAALVVGGLSATPAFALGSKDELTDRDQIVMNGRLVVAEGETVATPNPSRADRKSEQPSAGEKVRDHET